MIGVPFLTCKCIFDLYVHRKFEHFSQILWNIQKLFFLNVFLEIFLNPKYQFYFVVPFFNPWVRINKMSNQYCYLLHQCSRITLKDTTSVFLQAPLGFHLSVKPTPLCLDYWILQISLGMVQNPIPSCILRYTLRLVSRIDYSFDQWSVVSFVIKKPFVYLFMEKECIYLVIQMYLYKYANIFLPS